MQTRCTGGESDIRGRPAAGAPLFVPLLVSRIVLAQAPPIDLEQEPAPAAVDRIRVVYSGALGGIGAGQYPMEFLHDLEAAREEGLALPRLDVVHGALAQGELRLLAEDGRLASLVQGLGAGPTCDAPVSVTVLRTGTERMVFRSEALPDWMPDPGARGRVVERAHLRRCTGPHGEGMSLLSPETEIDPDWQIGAWEPRRAVLGEAVAGGQPVSPLLIFADPVQDPSRMHREAMRLLEASPGALFVDAGSYLDGVSSVHDDVWSLHRPLTWQMLAQLHPAALVPGETELVRGYGPFAEEQAGQDLPYLATNLAWSSPPAEAAHAGEPPCASPAHPLPRCRIVEVEGADGPVRIAFLGVLDPDLARFTPALGAEGLEILDPVEGTRDLVEALHAMPDPPDAVFLLTTASGDRLARLRVDLRGVDLLAGDPTFPTLRVERASHDLRPIPHGAKGAAVTLPLDGLATVDLEFQNHHLVRVEEVPRLVRSQAPADPKISAAISAVRLEAYPPMEQPLLPPADPTDPARPWTSAAWSSRICEAVRRATDADAVLLRQLPIPDRIPGALTELLVADQLALPDHLVLYRIPGDKLVRTLDRAWVVAPVGCGATSASPKANGRGIDPARTYRVVTTDRTLAADGLDEILQGLGASGLLDPAPVVAMAAPGGGPWTLRAAALSELRAERAAGFVAPPSLPPMWILNLRGASLRYDRFTGVENDAYASVPETLATSPSSSTLTGALDAALERSGGDVAWDLRLRGEYATIEIDSDLQETADDLRASSALTLPFAALGRRGPLTWDPYLELMYDTEITPAGAETGEATAPRQADLSLTVGLAAEPRGHWRVLRVGALVNSDLAHLEDKPPETGGKLEVGTHVDLGRWLDWDTAVEGQVWADTSADDESDLRLRVLGDTGLALPLARWLSVGAQARGFLVQGRVPATSTPAFAWNLGLALSAGGAWVL